MIDFTQAVPVANVVLATVGAVLYLSAIGVDTHGRPQLRTCAQNALVQVAHGPGRLYPMSVTQLHDMNGNLLLEMVSRELA